MIHRTILILCLLGVGSAAMAAEYTIQILEEPAPADEISPEIGKQLSPTGYKVMRGETATLCHIWLAKKWEVQEDFEATAEVLYPFTPGQLIGVIQFRRRGEDFRRQDINRGVYTLRYALQPVDGNHVGTSRTRDFLLVKRADEDKSPEPLDAEKLYDASARAVESSHPGMLSMQKVDGDAAEKPTIRQTKDEWWIARLRGTAQAGEKASPLAIDLVVVGHADE